MRRIINSQYHTSTCGRFADYFGIALELTWEGIGSLQEHILTQFSRSARGELRAGAQIIQSAGSDTLFIRACVRATTEEKQA